MLNSLSNEANSMNTPSEFEIVWISDTKNENKLIEVTYKKMAIAQISKDSKSGKINLHILTEYVNPELLSETKFLLNDFIRALSQAQKYF